MTVAITIAAVSCLLLVISVLVKPDVCIKGVHVPLYPFAALLGALLSVCCTPLTLSDCAKGMAGAGAVDPLKILTLFISVTMISVFLDEAGFFEYLASRVLRRAGGNGLKLFVLLYVTVSVLTVFTSNDIIILTFTPFIIFFCKSSGIKPTPFLVAEFTAANTWSMALVIGNPTNVYLATAAGVGFVEYLKVMILPAVLTGIAAFGVLLLLFFKTLSAPAQPTEADPPPLDKPQCALGLVMLGICTVGLAISGYIGVEMWIECAACAGMLILGALIVCIVRRERPRILLKAARRVPYALIPFVLAMFVISLSLERSGATARLAVALSSARVPLYGMTSFFACQLVNNIPMSVIFSSALSTGGAGLPAMFATVIGSNLGALLTPVGALAGIMFSSITKKHGVKYTAVKFVAYGCAVSAVTLPVALGTLYLVC